MKNTLATSLLLLPLGALLALSGCGSSSADDPLTGTWNNATCFGDAEPSADIERCTTSLTFTVGLDIDLVAVWFSRPATSINPGCVTSRRVSGQQWSTDAATFTVTGSGAATIERTGCVDPTDDYAATATSDIAIPGGDTSYQISGTTLTVLSGDLTGTYDK